MAGAAWSVWMFGLQGRGVEIASSAPPRIEKRVLIVRRLCFGFANNH
jgi:hypothetical protein